jgi:hypothetical protein
MVIPQYKPSMVAEHSMASSDENKDNFISAVEFFYLLQLGIIYLNFHIFLFSAKVSILENLQ